MVLIGKGCLGLDIWLKISDHAKNIKDMIRIVWVKETYCQQKASKTLVVFLQ